MHDEEEKQPSSVLEDEYSGNFAVPIFSQSNTPGGPTEERKQSNPFPPSQSLAGSVGAGFGTTSNPFGVGGTPGGPPDSEIKEKQPDSFERVFEKQNEKQPDSFDRVFEKQPDSFDRVFEKQNNTPDQDVPTN